MNQYVNALLESIDLFSLCSSHESGHVIPVLSWIYHYIIKQNVCHMQASQAPRHRYNYDNQNG